MQTPQILQQLSAGRQGLKVPPQIRQMINMLRSSGNPQAMLGQMMAGNPQVRQVMEIVQQYGGDADKAFRAIARQKGIDPQEIIDMMNGI